MDKCIFEYDIAKSLNNYAKHGIDFEESKLIFDDIELVEFSAKDRPAKEERRWMCLGRYKGHVWTVLITYRGTHDEHTRLISSRPAERNEEAMYERHRSS